MHCSFVNMAEELIEACLESFQNVTFLKSEQKIAVKSLLEKKDVFAVLPTGFGKSLIYQLYATAKLKSKEHCFVLVVSPLRSIVRDQMDDLAALGITAAELSEETFNDIAEGRFNVVFSSAENCLTSKFKTLLKEKKINPSLLVVDESHTVDTWGTQSKKKKNTAPFRKDYGNLAALRSFCSEGTPLLALTGTASEKTSKKIKKLLVMRPNTTMLTVSPDRKNIRYTVISTKKGQELEHLQWLVDIARECGVSMPKTIIFCNTYNEIAAVLAYLLRILGDCAYITGQVKCPANRIIGIFHSMTWDKYKNRVVESFKNDIGNVRIVLASSALGMGVNFPDVQYVIHLGAARSIVDHVQQAGRAGRDGKPAHNIVITTGSKEAHCEEGVKVFVRSSDCLRKALLNQLDKSVTSVLPMHACCSNCSLHCKCIGDNCSQEKLPFECEHKLAVPFRSRILCGDDKLVLQDALKEYQDSLNESTTHVFGSVAIHGFSDQLIEDVIKNAEVIFTLDDLFLNTPVFSKQHAEFILGIFQDIFQDMDDCEIDLEDFFEIEMEPWSQESDIQDYFDSDSDEGNPDVMPEL